MLKCFLRANLTFYESKNTDKTQHRDQIHDVVNLEANLQLEEKRVGAIYEEQKVSLHRMPWIFLFCHFI